MLAYALALFVRARDPTGYFSRLTAALCYACFVLNVIIAPALLGLDIGSVRVLASTIFAFILAYALRSRLQLCAASLGVLIYTAAGLAQLLDLPWWAFFEHPDGFFLPAAILMIVPALVRQSAYADFAFIYRSIGAASFYAALLTLGAWPSLGYVSQDLPALAIAYQAAALITIEVGIYVGIRYDIPEFTLLSAFAFLILILQQASLRLFQLMPAYAFFVMMSAIAVGGLYFLKTLRERINMKGSQ